MNKPTKAQVRYAQRQCRKIQAPDPATFDQQKYKYCPPTIQEKHEARMRRGTKLD